MATLLCCHAVVAVLSTHSESDNTIRLEAQHRWPRLIMSNGELQVSVIPALGGRIESITYGPTEREWLWSNDRVPLRERVYGASYADYDEAGWDECFPAVGPGPYPGRHGVELPDHGELWCQPWQWEREGGGIRMWVEGRALRYRFERTMRLVGDRLKVTYKVANAEPGELLHAYAVHPILAVNEDCRLILPPGDMPTAVYGSADDRLDPRDGGFDWLWPLIRQNDGTLFDASRVLSPHAHRAEKLFVERLPAGWAAVHDTATGDYLSLSWDTAALPYLGVWLNYGGWHRAYNVAIEPAAGAPDTLHEAVEWGRFATVAAGGEANWSITVAVGRGDEPVMATM